METVAWMVGREGGVTELLFDAPEPPFQISKELVFRVDADLLAQAVRAGLARKLELLADIEQLKERYRVLDAVNNENAQISCEVQAALQAKLDALMLERCGYGEYPRFIRPPHFDGRTEWKRVAENAQPAIRSHQVIDLTD